jgi:hypothetical protein
MDKHPLSPENAQTLLDITQSTVYLMGISFILGSLFTIFLLLVLDFMRRNKTEQ